MGIDKGISTERKAYPNLLIQVLTIKRYAALDLDCQHTHFPIRHVPCYHVSTVPIVSDRIGCETMARQQGGYRMEIVNLALPRIQFAVINPAEIDCGLAQKRLGVDV